MVKFIGKSPAPFPVINVSQPSLELRVSQTIFGTYAYINCYIHCQ